MKSRWVFLWVALLASCSYGWEVVNTMWRRAWFNENGSSLEVHGDYGTFVYTNVSGNWEISASFQMSCNSIVLYCPGDVGLIFMEGFRGSRNVYLMRAVDAWMYSGSLGPDYGSGGCYLLGNGTKYGAATWRATSGDSMSSSGYIVMDFKMTRRGNTFSAYIKRESTDWELFGQCQLPLNFTGNLGFYFGEYSTLTTFPDVKPPVIFSNVELSTEPPPLQKPVFDIHPMSQTIVAGANVTLNALATGFPDPVYSWWHSGRGWLKATGDACTITRACPKSDDF